VFPGPFQLGPYTASALGRAIKRTVAELSQEIQGKLRGDPDNACLEVTLLISYSNRRVFADSRFIYLRFWEVSL
jgi:hypothetical protein